MRLLKFLMTIFVGILIFLAYPTFGDDKSPTQEDAVRQTEIVKFKEIDSRLSTGEFLLGPSSLTVDDDFNLYVYDLMQAKIFVFNKNLELKTSFGKKGQGDGDFRNTGKMYPVEIFASSDGKLYCYEKRTDRIIVFTPKGKLVKILKNKVVHTRMPVADYLGNLYFPSESGGIIDVFDNSMKYKHFLLKEQFNYAFIVRPSVAIYRMMRYPRWQNVRCLNIKDTGTLIYLSNSSTLYLLKGKKIISKSILRPKKALNEYFLRIEEIKRKGAYGKAYIPLFNSNFFVDRDQSKCVYFTAGLNREKSRFNFYKYTVNGKLKTIIYFSPKKGRIPNICCKYNNYFCGVVNKKILFYKEVIK
jgi:hypothetical protein